jgi:hypothetical protein
MPALVTLEQMQRRSNDFLPDNEADLTFCGDAASAIVIDYLKIAKAPPDWLAALSDSPPGPLSAVPVLIQAAVLEVGVEMFKNREASVGDLLSPKVTAILWRQRDPALA